MNRYNKLRRLVSGLIAVAAVAAITFTGCTNLESTLGSDLTPLDQNIKLGQKFLYGASEEGINYFKTGLYRTDSLSSANMTYGYMGAMQNDTFGMRQAGFFTQYIPANILEDDIFGYMPIYDSTVLYLYVDVFAGDTLHVQEYEVFEVIDDSFITESVDSIYFPNFDMTPYIADEPIYTFKFPDQDNEIYTLTGSFRMEDTPQTAEFVARLMLEDTTAEFDETIYEDDEEWVNTFKGLYIRPINIDLTAGESSGAMYGTTLEYSGFGFYGRNREEVDPTLIKDTIGMTYIFYADGAEAGNVSLSTVEHDYTSSWIDASQIATPENSDVSSNPTIMVEGMAGVVSTIEFTPEFFAELDSILEEEEALTGDVYSSLFFNQAKMLIYMKGIESYDETLNPLVVTPWMDYMPQRLGMYSSYANYLAYDDDGDSSAMLTGIADYYYIYETSYGYTLDYGGDINRSWACYVMNISSFVQDIWNGYLSAKSDANDVVEDIDWDAFTDRTIYLAPVADDLFTLEYATAQGEASTENGAPIRMELTYTMIRK